MFFRARRALARGWFNLRSASLKQTAPMPCSDPGFTLVSMVCHGEAWMYLLAAKSLCTQLGRTPRVVLLNDGTLTAQDCALIAHHLPGARIVALADVPNPACPRGSCWERLLLIGDLVQQNYVVQLDSDTLTLAAVPEIAACIDENRSFTLLGDQSYAAVEPLAAACVRLKDNPSTMVQAVCERSFDQLPESADLLYLRGNAGFTGFARGSIDRDRIRFFSDLMRRIAGPKWDEWGSEQVTSSLLIANSPDPLALPSPKYVSYWAHPEVDYRTSSFIHFIGPHRFEHGFYLGEAQRVIARLPKQ